MLDEVLAWILIARWIMGPEGNVQSARSRGLKLKLGARRNKDNLETNECPNPSWRESTGDGQNKKRVWGRGVRMESCHP